MHILPESATRKSVTGRPDLSALSAPARKSFAPGVDLRALQIRSISTPGYYRAAHRLYLQVTCGTSGKTNKSWIFKYKFAGRAVEMGLGVYPSLSLASARKIRDEYSVLIAQSKDPRTERDRTREAYRAGIAQGATQTQVTFESCAAQVHELKLPEWRNAKHGQQWMNTLKTYVYPAFGKKAVAAIKSEDIVESLRPIWETKTETAWRTRDRVLSVLEWAEMQEFRLHDARLELKLKQALPDAKKLIKQKRKHHEALPYRAVGAFIARFNQTQCSAVVKLLHEFTILNGNRAGEARGALWSEIDLGQGCWLIHQSRMKGFEAHRIPLSSRAVTILKEVRQWSVPGSDLVFPSPSKAVKISDNTLTKQFRDMGMTHTVHGYRSSMRDWAAEQTEYQWEVMEKALAHKLDDETAAAYFRSDLYEKRKRMMEDWAAWCAIAGR